MLIDREIGRHLSSACRLALALVLGALTVGGAATAVAQSGAEVAYGRDDRVETFTLRGAQARNAAATVALVKTDAIRDNGNGTSTLRGPTLRTSENLCPGQRFAGQPTPAFCSGILLAPDAVATAGHCIHDKSDLARTRFVFGFAMIDDDRARTTLPNGKIHRGKRLLARQLDAITGNDYAIVELDRPVTDRKPAVLRRTGRVAKGAALYVIGHPNGLPAKFAEHAWVQANGHRIYFEANLDTFAGNSGSPVFDRATNQVVGLLVRGDDDYVPTPKGCNAVNVQPNRPGNEDVTRATVFAPFVPAR
jgi:V8-like Glu-specific endopeptidase